MSCGVGCRCSSDLALLWLWCRLVATALIQPLAQELPYAVGAALKKKKKNGEAMRSCCIAQVIIAIILEKHIMEYKLQKY